MREYLRSESLSIHDTFLAHHFVAPPELTPHAPVPDTMLNDPHFATQFDLGGYTDSAKMRMEMPLHEQVRNALPVWRALDAPNFVLDWIEHGVHLPMNGTPTPFT